MIRTTLIRNVNHKSEIYIYIYIVSAVLLVKGVSVRSTRSREKRCTIDFTYSSPLALMILLEGPSIISSVS